MKKTEILILTILLAGSLAFAGSGTVAIPATETTVLAARTARKWFILQNNSTNDIYVKVSSDTNALTTTNGIKLAAGVSMAISAVNANPTRNTITAISAAGTNSITYQEGDEN